MESNNSLIPGTDLPVIRLSQDELAAMRNNNTYTVSLKSRSTISLQFAIQRIGQAVYRFEVRPDDCETDIQLAFSALKVIDDSLGPFKEVTFVDRYGTEKPDKITSIYNYIYGNIDKHPAMMPYLSYIAENFSAGIPSEHQGHIHSRIEAGRVAENSNLPEEATIETIELTAPEEQESETIEQLQEDEIFSIFIDEDYEEILALQEEIDLDNARIFKDEQDFFDHNAKTISDALDAEERELDQEAFDLFMEDHGEDILVMQTLIDLDEAQIIKDEQDFFDHNAKAISDALDAEERELDQEAFDLFMEDHGEDILVMQTLIDLDEAQIIKDEQDFFDHNARTTSVALDSEERELDQKAFESFMKINGEDMLEMRAAIDLDDSKRINVNIEKDSTVVEARTSEPAKPVFEKEVFPEELVVVFEIVEASLRPEPKPMQLDIFGDPIQTTKITRSKNKIPEKILTIGESEAREKAIISQYNEATKEVVQDLSVEEPESSLSQEIKAESDNITKAEPEDIESKIRADEDLYFNFIIGRYIYENVVVTAGCTQKELDELDDNGGMSDNAKSFYVPPEIRKNKPNP